MQCTHKWKWCIVLIHNDANWICICFFFLFIFFFLVFWKVFTWSQKYTVQTITRAQILFKLNVSHMHSCVIHSFFFFFLFGLIKYNNNSGRNYITHLILGYEIGKRKWQEKKNGKQFNFYMYCGQCGTQNMIWELKFEKKWNDLIHFPFEIVAPHIDNTTHPITQKTFRLIHLRSLLSFARCAIVTSYNMNIRC